MSSTLSSKHGGFVTQFDVTNSSTAKQRFSFGKGARFPNAKKSISDQLQYELPETFCKRAPSFGVGDRFDILRRNNDSPSPDSYRLRSEFDVDGQGGIQNKIAFSFGVSREAYDKVYTPSLKINPDKTMPGPGQYTLLSKIGQEGKKFSLQGRTPYHKDIVRLVSKQGIPGPGSYMPKTGIDKFGVYHLSTLSNSLAPQISPRGQRFQNVELSQKIFVPGPGTYEAKDYTDGSYLLSQYKNPGTRRFGTAKRMELKFSSKDTPGPGQYRPPSDFGYVDIQKSPRTQQSPRSSMALNGSFFKSRQMATNNHDISDRKSSIIVESDKIEAHKQRRKLNMTTMF